MKLKREDLYHWLNPELEPVKEYISDLHDKYDKEQEENKRLNELVFAYESVNAPTSIKLKALLKVAVCPECDGCGWTVEADEYGEPYQCQCQWCDERSQYVNT